jgi:hypothetical protein
MEFTEDNTITKFWKMLLVVLLLGVLLAAGAIGIFIGKFHNYAVSSSVADWGSFGDYLGGVLNPVLAFLAFFGLLTTIALQRFEIIHIADNALKADIYANVTKLESDFFYILDNTKIRVNYQQPEYHEEVTARDILHRTALPFYNDLILMN